MACLTPGANGITVKVLKSMGLHVNICWCMRGADICPMLMLHLAGATRSASLAFLHAADCCMCVMCVLALFVTIIEPNNNFLQSI